MLACCHDLWWIKWINNNYKLQKSAAGQGVRAAASAALPSLPQLAVPSDLLTGHASDKDDRRHQPPSRMRSRRERRPPTSSSAGTGRIISRRGHGEQAGDRDDDQPTRRVPA